MIYIYILNDDKTHIQNINIDSTRLLLCHQYKSPVTSGESTVDAGQDTIKNLNSNLNPKGMGEVDRYQATTNYKGVSTCDLKTFNISGTLVGNKIVDHSDVVGAAPTGDAPTTSEWSTIHLHSRLNTWPQWIGTETTARRDDLKHLSVGIWCVLY